MQQYDFIPHRFADKNPLEILLIFMGEQNLRLVDLFRSFDKDQSGGLTRDEFIVGLQVTTLVPLPCTSKFQLFFSSFYTLSLISL